MPPDDDLGRDDPYRVILVACTTCRTAMVLCSNYLYGPEDWDTPENVWPNGAPVVDAPYRIQRAFRETYRCFHQASAYSATATMARRACTWRRRPDSSPPPPPALPMPRACSMLRMRRPVSLTAPVICSTPSLRSPTATGKWSRAP
ncbi:hypothetical protein ACFVW5_23865 [Streptomyces sp. NPDC058232]|uniref:hypothetical protein n=1 Tax=Streptomyces sp. NPDC058232 TaxID=3346393 RepID=UPI0036EC613D